ncbi:polyadenylate-binding protein-interacting protein 1-like isoform X3 [Lineus longissimus]|uniref:polyadenylate-binding protein-interacting protein 1-like isoform X3 n=1 Tax=Lineus longissimus TaxID=88925 RepID=UPI002B4EBBF3
MADRGAGEGSMPSPIGRGRGRGGGGPAGGPGGNPILATGIVPPPRPGMQTNASPSSVVVGSVQSPGGKSEGGLRRPNIKTQERLLGPGGDACPPTQKPQFTNNNVQVQKTELVPQAPISKASSDLNVNAAEFVSKSTLNVTAKEFVPRNVTSNPQPQSQPQQMPQPSQKTDLSGRLESMSSWASVPTVLTTPTNNYAVDRVKQVVFRLTVAPGNMEEFMIPLVGDLNDEQVDLTTVIDMINVIFEQAIAESNFTYTGARMCDWFVRDYKPKTNGEPIKFLGLLMKRCQVEQEKSQILAQENPTRLQGFTLFMAELFQNVKIVAQGGEERIEVLGKKLRELVRTLLTHPSDSNLKCVVRILKCTGAVLEDTERLLTGQALDMDNLITFCLQQAMSPHASESARAMLKKVADIRSTNWGRIESAPVQVVAPPQPRAPSPFTQSDPVFFDPYGRMITREEAGFAEGELEYSFGDGYPDEWSSQDLQYQEQEFDPSFDNGYLDTEIDSEIADAFEQFLIETQQAI